MIFTDINTDIYNDLNIINGDLLIQPSDTQHIQDILISSSGYFKEFPLCGCNSEYYLNSSGKMNDFRSKIEDQLKKDGYNVNSIIINLDGTIKIDSNR